MANKNRLPGWLLSSSTDVIGRLCLQLISTAAFTRLLAPQVFGQAALTMVYVGLLSVLVTAPFEEALAQRGRIRKQHFASALAAVMMLGTFIAGAVIGATWLLPRLGVPLPPGLQLAGGYCLILIANGPLSILLALERRHRRFHTIAACNLLGMLIGTSAGLVLAISGAGTASLLSVSFVGQFATVSLLLSRRRIVLVPKWSWSHLQHLRSFAQWHLADRITETLNNALCQTLVTQRFGLEGNGYLNMAMRVVEPLRGATGAIGHNIAMSVFQRAQFRPQRLGEAVERAIRQTSLLLQPMFIGLAVIAPTLITVIAGPGWSAATTLATCLALAAAVASPANFAHGGLSALGRADLGFALSTLELLTTVAALLLLSPLGIIAIGLARLIAWTIDAILVFACCRRLIRLRITAVGRALMLVTLCTSAMAAAVLLAGLLVQSSVAPIVRLGVEIAIGLMAYAGCTVLLNEAELNAVRINLLDR